MIYRITKYDPTLRECFLCRLVDPQGRAAVWFGYDYYMYVACEEIPAALVREICAGGLYVEAQTTKGSWLNQDKQANAGWGIYETFYCMDRACACGVDAVLVRLHA